MNRDSVVPVLTEHVKRMPIRIQSMAMEWSQRELMRPKGYDKYLLMQCLSGEGIIDHRGEKVKISMGDTFIWEPGVAQLYRNVGGEHWGVNWISFMSEHIPLEIESGFYKSDVFPMSLGIAKLDTIKGFLEDESISGQMRASAVLYELLSEINIYKERLEFTGESFDLKPVTDYMKQHIGSRITLRELSYLFNVSESYLCKLFYRKYRTTPIAYFIELKVGKAKELLIANPQEKILKVAALCGYEDSVYFTRVFKKYVGQTPSAYRKEQLL